ncbi:MAG: HD domain-containing protein [Candidatus Marinimicrobia bacterium]|nr:HD domain-containing protein [Candidatus Neomarinimicrobiota bacterium]
MYNQLDYNGGQLFDLISKPSNKIGQDDWLNKGEWLIAAKKAGAEKIFFVENNPVVVFAECKNDLTEKAKAFNRIWSLARPRLLFLASPGEITVYDLAQKPLVFSGKSKKRNDLKVLAALHDIGKVAIPDAILLKPGKLNLEEIQVMQTHAAIGRNAIRTILKSSSGVDFLHMAEDITGSHHEWFDGSSWGYPDGLKGEEIPLSARIVALADVYDAITSRRVYKSAMSHEKAREIIADSAGTQFDPVIVDAFLRREMEFMRLASRLSDQGKVNEHSQEIKRRDVA